MKRHTTEEIAEKLRQAAIMADRGLSQSQICKSLGVSVMTFHRWRKQLPAYANETVAAGSKNASDGADTVSSRGAVDDTMIQELQLENRRLRRIVTDLLLEKTKIEEAIEKRLSRPK